MNVRDGLVEGRKIADERGIELHAAKLAYKSMHPQLTAEELPAPCSDCGLPDGRQSNCLTCHGKPIADAVSEKPEFEVTE